MIYDGVTTQRFVPCGMNPDLIIGLNVGPGTDFLFADLQVSPFQKAFLSM